ncbi:MAG: hypothetical protein GC204_00215 [Chloroflexi bacterium]|nr:hypothetical protein [Chloroflexota bacterium]
MSDVQNDANFLEGVSAFQSARLHAFWDEVLALVRGKPAELLSFEDIRTRLRLREENYRGLQEVPLDQIAGSVGRYREFTGKFLPKKNKMQERWSRVYAQASGMTGLPPIELYKVGDVYFVRDGNHRVSVARQLGSKTIQAHVTELPTSISLRPGMSEEELGNVTAYAEFLDITRLPHLRPHHQSMTLSEPSRYDDLLGHINLHRSVMESTEGHPVTIEEAAADWYDNVYRPAVTLIRKYDMLKYMPKRTEGDLYLWMIDHLREVKEAYGEEADVRTFSDALVDYLSEKHIPVPKDLLTEKDDTVTLARVDVERQLRDYRARMQQREPSPNDVLD